MEFKFKKGQQVQIKSTEMFSAFFGSGGSGLASAIGGRITDFRVHNHRAQYRVSGFTGWWDEDCLQEV